MNPPPSAASPTNSPTIYAPRECPQLPTELAPPPFPRQSAQVTIETDPPLLLYDGSCGFCARSVQFLLRHEGARRDLRFAPLDGATGRRIRSAHPGLQGVDSMVWVEGGRALARSDGVLRAARYLGGGWRVLGVLGEGLPRSLRDGAYRLVASHRHRLAGPACVVPTAAQRARFLDLEG